MKRPSRNTVAKFVSLIATKHGGGCFEYSGCKATGGYGVYCYNGKNIPAHRFSYTIFKGEIPSMLVVRHTCDNPPCCNPEHLLLGTGQDNFIDALKRNRVKRIKTKEADIIDIRKCGKMSPGAPLILSKIYGLHVQTIEKIINKVHYRYIK